ncbi:MAG TPA: hypothetical protein VKT82_33410 [Ktedonobacterales bacterium]|nr:hypothetical protein [Ktedonobacterales bacterium]
MKQMLALGILGLILVLLCGCQVQSHPAAAAGNVVTMGSNNFE